MECNRTTPAAGLMYELALFAGAGGGILGGILDGRTCVGAVEIETYPRRVLMARQRDGMLPWFPIWDDIRTFRSDNPSCGEYFYWLRSISGNLVVSGGFPCQDISAAGKGAGITGSRSGLWGEMARVIGEVGPAFVLCENSPMLTKRGLGVVLRALAEMGYDARWGVLGASDAEAPHKRERIWVVANSIRDTQRKEPRRRTTGRVGRIIKSVPWNEPPACALSRLRGVDDRLAGAVDRTDCIRNGQVPVVASLAWNLLKPPNQ